jgi:uncharacterized repeat protein (TIGR03843 family)
VNPSLPIDETEVLATGDLALVGRLDGSTNHAMLVEVRWTCPGEPRPIVLEAVYKPTAGERPLHDFPDGTLTRREVAAFLVSEAMGWRIVPPTVLRDGPYGEGMVQRWIQPDPTVDVIALVVDCDPRLRRIAVFDAVVNNTDRKGGHLLPVPGGHVYGVDHGVCFSPVPKLRTVLWGWRGRPLSDDELAGLDVVRDGLRADLGAELRELLSAAEVGATLARVERLLRDGTFPNPRRDWPAIPFPPF